jgi:hypothetical protein
MACSAFLMLHPGDWLQIKPQNLRAVQDTYCKWQILSEVMSGNYNKVWLSGKALFNANILLILVFGNQ